MPNKNKPTNNSTKKGNNLINRESVMQGLPETPVVGPGRARDIAVNGIGYNPHSPNVLTASDMWNQALNSGEQYDRVSYIDTENVYQGDKYASTLPGTDYEEGFAQQQSTGSKWLNASAKMVGTAATTFVSGTLGLAYGAGEAILTQRLASIVDNPVTRGMDDVQKGMENYIPNLYTKSETEAEWWAPDNLMTANFWSDKVLKNLGFSLGSMAGGLGWSSLFKTMGMTQKLIRAGKGMEAAAAAEKAIATAPKAARYTAIQKGLKALDKGIKQPAGAVLRDADRILISTTGTFGEATIEGLGAMTEMQERMLAEFKLEHGRLPTEEEQTQMKTVAERAGLYVWGMNALILTGTNYIQLGKIVGSSRKADKALINSVKKNKEGIWEAAANTSKFGKSVATARQIGRILFAPVESVEEGLQFAATSGVDDYFSKVYENREDVVGVLATLSEVSQHVYLGGLHETLNTKEGLEGMLIGALSGGMQQAGIVGSYKGKDGKTKYGFGKSGNIAEYGILGRGGERGKNTAMAVTALNLLTAEQALKDGVNYMAIGIGSQEKRQTAIKNDDKLGEKNAEADYALSYLIPRIKYGKISSVLEELKNYKSQSSNTEGFEELKAQGIVNEKETAEKFGDRIDNLIDMAISMDKSYEIINDRYENLTDEKGVILYTADVIDKMVYTASKVKDYDKRIIDLQNELLSSGADLSIINEKITNGEILTEADIEAVKATATNIGIVEKDDFDTNIQDYAELLLQRKQFAQEYQDIKAEPLNFKDVKPAVPTAEEVKTTTAEETVTINTKNGTKTYSTKDVYYYGKMQDRYLFPGKSVSAPFVQIIGTNPDGTIKIKISLEEKERDVTEGQLEEMQLGSTSNTNNKKGMYYLDNWNTPFEMNFGENAPAKQGRIIYDEDSDKMLFLFLVDGKKKSVEVTNDQFAPKGDKAPQIQRVQPANRSQAAIEEQFIAAKDERRELKHEDSLNVLGELLDETTKRQEATKKSIKTRRSNLERTKKKIAELNKELPSKLMKRRKEPTYTKEGKVILSTIRSLEKDVIALEKVNASLEADLEETAVTIAYVQNLIDNIDNSSTNLDDYVSDLKKNAKHLLELQKQTKASLDGVKSLIEKTKEAIIAAKNVLHDILSQLGVVFPSISREGIDLNDDVTVENYLSDLAEFTGSESEGDKLAFAGVTMDQAKPNKSLLKKLDKAVIGLEKELSDLEKSLALREIVLDKFGVLQELREQIKQEEEFLANNPIISEQILGTLDPSPQPPSPQQVREGYQIEPRKSDILVVTSGVAPVRSKTNPVGVYADRAQTFGNKFHELEADGKKFKGSVVTMKNENKIIPGLSKHLIGDSGADPRTNIILVITDDKGIPVDQNGNTIEGKDLTPEQLEARYKDEGIFQTFPSEDLEQRGQTMFRDSTELAERTRLREIYTKWRKTTLKSEELESQEIGASFGLLEYIEIPNADGTINIDASLEARSSAADAGLMDNHILQDKGVILIGEDEALIQHGSTAFTAQEGKSLLGHVFLKVPGGLVKLFNKKNSKKQAETIYEVLLQVTKNIAIDGNAKGNDTQDLFNWLKTVVYWGRPATKEGVDKEPSSGSIWYEVKNSGEGTPYERKLRIGKTSKSDFTTAYLEKNKDQIIALLQEVYGNTHKPSVSGNAHTKPYAEVTGIGKDGKIIPRVWKNYQSYLLANEYPDGSERVDDDIPLKTRVRPLVGGKENDQNRKGIYFSLDNKAAYVAKPKPKIKKKVGKKTVVSGDPIFNGIVENTIPLQALGEGYVKMDMDKVIEVYNKFKSEAVEDVIGSQMFVNELIDKKILEVALDRYTLDNIIKNTSATNDAEATQWAYDEVINIVKVDIVAATVKADITPDPPAEPTIEDKKADIEKRRIQEKIDKEVNSMSETQGTILKRRKEIDAKYDAELAALSTPVKPAEDIEEEGFKMDGSEELFSVFGKDLELHFKLDKAALLAEIEANPNVTSEVNRNALTVKLMKSGALEAIPSDELYLRALETHAEDEIHPNFAAIILKGAIAQIEEEQALADEVDLLPEDDTTDDDAKKAAAKAALAKRFSKPKKRTDNKTDDLLREKDAIQLEPFKSENWEKVSAWMAKNFPNIPLYRVQNVIQSTNGRQAWGLYRQGAIYVMQDAEAGTAYHEIFHAVWEMMVSPKEKKAIMKEFRDRNGSYNDRFTQEEIKFAEATDLQINEEMAEEFRDKRLYNTEPKRKPKSLIKRLFADIVEFFNTFILGKDSYNNAQKLFNKMGNGDYAAYIPQENSLEKAGPQIRDIENLEINDDDQLRVKFEGISAIQEHEIYQNMTFKLVKDLTATDEGLFRAAKKLQMGAHYPELLEDLVGDDGVIALKQERLYEIAVNDDSQYDAIAKKIADFDLLKASIIANWDIPGGIRERHMDTLLPYEITFDTTEEALAADENVSSEDIKESNKIDTFKKAGPALRLILATVPDIQMDETTGRAIPKPSSIGGVTFEQSAKIYITVMNAVHSSVNMDEMLSRLKALGLEPNGYHYANLYLRLTGESVNNEERGFTDPIDPAKQTQGSLRLLTGLWKTMKKQNPDSPIVYILENGEVEVSDTNLSNASKQRKYEMGLNIITTLKEDADLDGVMFKQGPNGLYNPTKALKNKKFDSDDLNQYILFLKAFEIDFNKEDLERLKITDYEYYILFLEATTKILKNIQSMEDVRTFSVKGLDSAKRLLQLAAVSTKISSPAVDSTHFGLDGERTQNYIGTNAGSDLFDALSDTNYKEDLRDTPYEYLLTDVFSKGSLVLERLYNSVSGKKASNSQDIMKPVNTAGTNNEMINKKIVSSDLKDGERLTQEINLNLAGIYSTLVSGDSQLEHGVRMHSKDVPFMDMAAINRKDYLTTFRGYFIDEVNLSRDNRILPKGRNKTDLRFFKDIFNDSDPTLNDDIGNEPIDVTPEAVYDKFETRISRAVEEFINEDASVTGKMMQDYQLIKPDPNNPGNFTSSVDFGTRALTADNIKAEVKKVTVNYMIANIEQHKLLYSDPYQYLDELKRVKNFHSPRQSLLYGSESIRKSFDAVYNKGYKEGDLGYSDMNKMGFSTLTIEDVLSSSEMKDYMNSVTGKKDAKGNPIYKENGWKESDGAGLIAFQAHRIYKILADEWTPSNEAQYRYDIEFQEKVIAMENAEFNDKLSTTRDLKLFRESRTKHDKSTYTPSKPIVSGNKANDRNFNDTVLDKYALFPLSFRVFYEMNPNSNMVKFTEKMRLEKIDYAIYQSGRKVGTELTYPLYVDGKLNDAPFQTLEEKEQTALKDPEDRTPRRVTEVPFSIMAVQGEVPSKESNKVVQGSQPTKLVTLDLMDGGVPVDYLKEKGRPSEEHEASYDEWRALSEEEKREKSPLYKEIQHNKDLLETRAIIGYNSLLKRLSITETTVDGKSTFKVSDTPKMLATIKKEIAKQDMNINLIDAFEGVKQGDVLLEATSAYQQIRSTLMAIATKSIIKQKVTGGQLVQMPSTLFEEGNRLVRETVVKNGETKTYLASDNLRFYEEETVAEDGTIIKAKTMEIMVGRWFKSDKSDAELIEYLNNTPEGQRILNGVGFRTPTQKQNSIEAFKVKQFLPAEYGDAIVIPSGIVKKTGSDFDIDKLSVYLKNTFTNKEGFPELIPYFGMDEVVAKKKYRELFTKRKEKDDVDALLKALGLEDLLDPLDQAAEGDVTDLSFEAFVDHLYAKGVENEYIESLERLIMNPFNFDRLVKPNSALELESLAAHINKKRGRDVIQFKSPGFMLHRKNMLELRRDFVGGKKAISVAATGQTNTANNQLANVYVDILRSDNPEVSKDDRWFLNGMTWDHSNPELRFQEYNKVVIDGITMPTLSRPKNSDGDYISDINGMFIDGYVDISGGPWIMQMGATPQTAATWLYLVKIGVPIKTTAYFMNQPIIADLLQQLEVTGSTWIYDQSKIDALLRKYKSNTKEIVELVPTENQLDDMIGETVGKMSPLQKKQQTVVLKEFLKVSVMANHLFKTVQGTNIDTANLNDQFLLFKKAEQLKIARKTIISSPDKILDSTFLGGTVAIMDKVQDGLAEILLSGKNNTDRYDETPRNVLNRVMLPYVEMSDRNFVTLSNSVVSNFFDFMMQTDKFTGNSINSVVAKVMLGTETEESVAKQIIKFKESVYGKVSEEIPANEDHPLYGNVALEAMMLIPGLEEGVPDNITIRGNKQYDQNLIINSFAEIRDYFESNPEEKYAGLYLKMVRLAVLQSGLSNSHIAFSKLLPYEDFKGIYNDTLDRLEGSSDISNYADLNMFERNSWFKGDWIPMHENVIYDYGDYKINITTGNIDPRISSASDKNFIPRTIFVNEGKNDANDVIVYKWSEYISSEKRRERAKTNDTRHLHKTLMRKVYEINEAGERVPLIQTHVTKNKSVRGYVYVAINAWGDSFRAKEFYNPEPVITNKGVTGIRVPASKLNNGFDKVVELSNGITKYTSGEVSDRVIVDLLNKDMSVSRPDIFDTEVTPNNFTKEINKGDHTIEVVYSIADGKYYSKSPGSEFEDGISRKKEISKKIYDDAYNNVNPSSTNPLGNIQGEVKETVPLKKAEVKPAKVSTRILKADIAFAEDQERQGVLVWDGRTTSSRIDLDLPRPDITAGAKAIKAGKQTKNAMRVTLALKQAKATGYYTYMQGSGGTTNRLQVPIVDTTGKDPNQTNLFDQDLSEQEFNQENNDECPF